MIAPGVKLGKNFYCYGKNLVWDSFDFTNKFFLDED